MPLTQTVEQHVAQTLPGGSDISAWLGEGVIGEVQRFLCDIGLHSPAFQLGAEAGLFMHAHAQQRTALTACPGHSGQILADALAGGQHGVDVVRAAEKRMYQRIADKCGAIDLEGAGNASGDAFTVSAGMTHRRGELALVAACLLDERLHGSCSRFDQSPRGGIEGWCWLEEVENSHDAGYYRRKKNLRHPLKTLLAPYIISTRWR